MDHASTALELAAELGFDQAGITALRPPRAAERFRAWLAAGRHGSMRYLERQAPAILDPRRLREGARTLLVVGLGHSRSAVELPGGARVARYAAGRDYHNVVGRLLRKLARRLEQEGLSAPFRAIVDAGPLLERSHAAEAGLGHESKAANLLSPRFGPWLFLGELLLGETLEPTDVSPALSCGTCTACLDACPTGAILEPGVVDARLCLSYLTIEHRGPIPRELRPALGPWVFGCDVCSEVCPWGAKAPDLAARFGGTHPALAGVGEGAASPLLAWLRLDDAAFASELNGSPLQRPRREGLARNAAIVLGNHPVDGGSAALRRALELDPSPLVREAAAWGLRRGYGVEGGVRDALEAAIAREPEERTRGELRRTLEEAP